MYMSISPAIPLLGNYPIEIKALVIKTIYTRMTITHLSWKNPKTKRMPFGRKIDCDTFLS